VRSQFSLWKYETTENLSYQRIFGRKSHGIISKSIIYIYKEECLCVCLFIIYAFGHDMTKCNEILQAIPFRPGEGRRVVFNPKFSPQGGVCPPPIVRFTTINTIPESLCAWLFLNSLKMKVYKNLRFLQLCISFRILKKNEWNA
jgi:hypothetical protein